MSPGSYPLPNQPQDPDDQKLFREFVKIGLRLYLQSAGKTTPGKRHGSGLPSRESVLAEAAARGYTKLTQWRFQTFWRAQVDYWGDLAVFAHSLDCQQQSLYRLRQKLVKKAIRLSREGEASLSGFILDGSVADIRRRVRLVGRIRTIQGMPISTDYRVAALSAERWAHDKHNTEWSRCYGKINKALDLSLEELIPNFTVFAACLADRLANHAYLEEATNPSGASPVEAYGKILSQQLVRHLSGALPHIDFNRPCLPRRER